jgi:hypothetical protein
MKYDYTNTLATNTKGKITKRPMIELELLGKEHNINVLGLIDSGADTVMMNVEYARDLGIDLKNTEQKEFLGIGNSRVKCYLAKVDMKIKHFDKIVSTIVAFTESPSVDILLGQEDFFEVFRIKFEKDHNTFEVSLSPLYKK